MLHPYVNIKNSFGEWIHQKKGLEKFEEYTNTQNKYDLYTSIYDSCAMRERLCCGSGKSRLNNTIMHKFIRSCGLFMSISLIYQFLFDDIFGKCLDQSGKQKHPDWMDPEREILIICSQNYKKELTHQQYSLLRKQNMNFDGSNIKYTVTTRSSDIKKFLIRIIRENKKCTVLCTYHSAKKLTDVIDEIVDFNILDDKESLFGVTIFDEAHRVCTEKRGFLYKTLNSSHDKVFSEEDNFLNISSDDEVFSEDEEIFSEEDSDTTQDELQDELWVNLPHFGYRYFTTATYSKKMKNMMQYFGPELYIYTFPEAVADEVVSDFDVHINLDWDIQQIDLNKNMDCLEDSIRKTAQAMRDENRSRVLMFHRFSNDVEKKGTSARNAAKYQHIFADTIGVSEKEIWLKVVHSNMSASQRSKIFNDFQKPNNDNIYRIIVNCRVVGTGIDLKNIDMVVFVDPRHGYVEICQNVCRSTRINEYDNRNSIVFLPITIPRNELFGKSKEERNEEIQNILNKTLYSKLSRCLLAIREINPTLIDELTNFSKSNNSKKKKNTVSINSTPKKRKVETKKRFKITVSDSFKLEWDIDEANLYNILSKTAKLIMIGYSPKDKIWEDKYLLLQKYLNEFGKIPRRGTIYENFNIGEWVKTQKKTKNLSLERKYKLEQLKLWTWNCWDKKYILLKKYTDKFDKIPSRGTMYKVEDIGEWVNTQKKKQEELKP